MTYLCASATRSHKALNSAQQMLKRHVMKKLDRQLSVRFCASPRNEAQRIGHILSNLVLQFLKSSRRRCLAPISILRRQGRGLKQGRFSDTRRADGGRIKI